MKFLDEEHDILNPQINQYINWNIRELNNNVFDILKYVVLRKYPGFYHNLDTHLLSSLDIGKIITNMQSPKLKLEEIPQKYHQYFDSD
ncbi:glycosyltransferase [Spiroplasma mirum]|uniref:glycosyltransferase n=1 Tax=Spiroplasma mirum TaxID=2144 RepID=UPI0038CD91C2